MYLLDGESNFRWASQLAQYMCDNLQIPDLIIVGIPNTDRIRDLTPTRNPGVASSGGGELFEKFLGEELIPCIDVNFRTDPYRILFGHSIGGPLAMDALLRRSNAFQAYILADPSLWWDNETLTRRAKETLPKAKDLHATVFIATARHAETNSIKSASEHFFKILKRCPSPGLQARYQYFDGEDHGSVRLQCLYDGLLFVFQDYKPRNFGLMDSPSSITDNFKKLSERLGYTFLPPERYVNKLAGWLLQDHKADPAIACFNLNVANYPASSDAYASLAEAYAAKGEREMAISNFEKSLHLSPGNTKATEGLKSLRSR